MQTKTAADARSRRDDRASATAAAAGDRRTERHDRDQAIQAAPSATPLDWGHYIESRMQDFQARW